MRTVTPALAALINAAGGANPLVPFDLYYFTLAGGLGTLLYGTADFVITAADATIWNPPAIDGSGGLWQAGLMWQPGLIADEESRAQGHWKVGLDSDTWEFDVAPRAVDSITGQLFPDQIAGHPWISAAQMGLLDGADLIVSTAYFAAMPKWPMPPGGASPVGTFIQFRGQVGPVRTTSTTAHITATDYRAQLRNMMPRNQYQASCRHRLFDARCTLSAGGFTAAAVAGAGSIAQQVVASAAVAAPAGSGTFELGVLTFTSGANNGISRTVSEWDGAKKFTILVPFPYVPAPGDTFSVQAGCDKTLATCTAFSNLANFGGEPYIPIPEVSIG